MNEFEFLSRLRSKYSLDRTGDDCAVLPFNDATDLLLTTDLLVEDVDFRAEWAVPEFLGHKALAVSLSDIAAMGGVPRWSMLSIGVPERLWNSDFLDRFYEGWFTLARKYDVELVGGDISRAPDRLVIDSSVGGQVQKGKAWLRSAARAGDAIFVSGALGGAAGGLQLLENGMSYSPDVTDSHNDLMLMQLRPEPELNIAKHLHDLDIVTSAIDLSDGLSSDLRHLCLQSRLGAVIYAEKLPMHPDLIRNFAADQSFALALNGGEDLRVLFTVSPENTAAAESIGANLIGNMTTSAGQLIIIDAAGPRALDPAGFRHF